MKTHSLFAACSTVLALAGCEETGLRRPSADAGITAPSDIGNADVRRRDAGPPALQFSYTPTGCDYEVTTPEVLLGAMGGDVVGSAPAPIHVHLGVQGATDTSMAVNWSTDLDTTLTQMLVGTDETAVTSAEAASEGVTAITGHTFLVPAFTGAFRLHETHACGLTPATVYHYKVGGPGHWSATYSFTTAPVVGSTASYTFAVVGDSRGDAELWAATEQAIASHSPDFQLFSGDAVAIGGNQPEWDAWFSATVTNGGDTFAVQDLLATMPLFPTNGNHDGLSINYVTQMIVPQEVSPGERGVGKQWYSFNYANAHIVVLDDSTANEAIITGEESTWLRADLAAVNRSVTPWVFVMHHRPAYSCSTNHGSDRQIRQAWQSIYDDYRVDFVFNGHDHDYERSKPIRGFQEGSENGAIAESGPNGVPVAGSGTVYVVAAGAGAPLYGVDDTCDHQQESLSARNFVIITIEGTSMQYRAYGLTENVIDSFDYTK